MVSMLMKEYTAGKGSTVRSRMVLFLVFGDFWLGVIGVIPTLATLTGNPPREGTGFCNSMGFLLAVSIYVQHLNTLTLCVSTFLILIHPLSLATRILERYWRWLFPLPWVLACILCGIAWGTQGDWGVRRSFLSLAFLIGCLKPTDTFRRRHQTSITTASAFTRRASSPKSGSSCRAASSSSSSRSSTSGSLSFSGGPTRSGRRPRSRAAAARR